MAIHITNHKLPTIHSESVPRSRSKVRTYSYMDKKKLCIRNMVNEGKYIYTVKPLYFHEDQH